MKSRSKKKVKEAELEHEHALQTAFWGPLLVTLFLTGAKFLCFPLYRSTDFEVHRNWMAITHSLPIDRWYHDNTSEWTLDYPPFFAWFEYALSFPARLVDPGMVDVKNLNYESEATVYFLRTSVVLSDLVFALGVYVVATALTPSTAQNAGFRVFLTFCLLFGDVNLFMVDHMHFQYNGFMNGLLFISIACMIRGRPLLGGFFFATLLNFKHIYLYIAPAFFFHLLFTECFPAPATEQAGDKGRTSSKEKIAFSDWVKRFDAGKFVGLGLVVTGVFAASLGPFLAMGQAGQLRERLFPFKRGLTHAYWAPNFWGLYNAADKVLAWKFPYLPPNATFDVSMVTMDPIAAIGKQEDRIPSSTSGRVEEFRHVVLPAITPLTTFLFTAPFVLLSVVPILLEQTWESFLESLILCAWTSFLFGWHVHEKAILMITLPVAVLSIGNWRAAWIYCILQFIGSLSIFPLFFTPNENILKVLLWVASSAAVYSTFQRIHSWGHPSFYNPVIAAAAPLRREKAYLVGAVFVWAYYMVLHSWIVGDRFEFLPLMAVSVYCAVGVMYLWWKFLLFSLLSFLKRPHYYK